LRLWREEGEDAIWLALDLFEEAGSIYCTLGGLGVNAQAEPAADLGLDLAVLEGYGSVRRRWGGGVGRRGSGGAGAWACRRLPGLADYERLEKGEQTRWRAQRGRPLGSQATVGL